MLPNSNNDDSRIPTVPKCMVKGCDVHEDLVRVILVIPAEWDDRVITYVEYPIGNFPLCYTHAANIRDPLEIFQNKPQIVRRMLRQFAKEKNPGIKCHLNFEDMNIKTEPYQ